MFLFCLCIVKEINMPISLKTVPKECSQDVFTQRKWGEWDYLELNIKILRSKDIPLVPYSLQLL